MDFLVILGRQPELSLAELRAVGLRPEHVQPDVAHVREAFDWQRLGGVVKACELLGDFSNDTAMLADVLANKKTAGKLVFGVSVYGPRPQLAERVAVAVKRMLVERGRSVRFVRGENGKLSSVVVAKEKLTELLLVQHGSKTLLGITTFVQPFEEYSRRDYGRPGRDAASGMLPPKLARMMVNFAGVKTDAAVLDPFCGSGTVLQEALLLGFANVTGSDVEEKAIEDTKKNLSWLKLHANVFRSDVRGLMNHLKSSSIDAVVTEPYLGPQRGSFSVRQTQDELSGLYRSAFDVFAKLLKPHGRVVFLFPVFHEHGEQIPFPFVEKVIGKDFSLHTRRGELVYERPGQRVGREIVVAERH